MWFWRKWSALDRHRIVEELQLLLRQSPSLHAEHVDRWGQTLAFGKCRLHEVREEERRLVIDVPSADGRMLALKSGDAIRISFPSGAVWRSFDSAVGDRLLLRSRSGDPIPALLLREPEEITNGNRRQSFRVTPFNRSMPKVRVQSLDAAGEPKSNWVSMLLRDISARGVSLQAPQATVKPFRDRPPVQIALELPNRADSIEISGFVKRYETLENEAARIAVELRLDDQQTEMLETFLAKCQRELMRDKRRP